MDEQAGSLREELVKLQAEKAAPRGGRRRGRPRDRQGPRLRGGRGRGGRRAGRARSATTAEAVGDLKESTGKKGDVVVASAAAHGPAQGRIVFEAKTARMTRPKALEELDGARAERNADYAVLVVPSEDKVPAKMQALREYNGDKLIVAFDPDDGPLALQVAYSLARARVLMARGDGEGVDAAAVSDTVERALVALEDVRRIRQQLTGAKTQIDKASEIVGAMSERVRAHLDEIAALVRDAAERDQQAAVAGARTRSAPLPRPRTRPSAGRRAVAAPPVEVAAAAEAQAAAARRAAAAEGELTLGL